jgi:hypothetical protein
MRAFKIAICFSLLTSIAALLAVCAGCEIMPVTRYKPTLHNPFIGEMKTIAILPFFNYSDNPNANGREFAKNFANELQRIPGFIVIANKIVEETMLKHNLHKFESVDDIRYLAQLLKVDVVVVGKIHGFSMNYPPYTKFETEWYSVNPYLHPIPAGYGLPWGTEYEQYIPDKIVLQAEMALAEAQIKTQTPKFDPIKPRAEPEADGSEDVGLSAPKESLRDRRIRLMAATIPNNLDTETVQEPTLEELADRRQALSLNNQLKGTGVPYVPDGLPVTNEEKTLAKMRSEIGHPLQNGPWQSETQQPNQLPWSQQSPYPEIRANTANPGGYEGNYAGYPIPPNVQQTLTPEQLQQYGWVHQPIPAVPPQYRLMPGMPVEGRYGMIYGEPDRFPGLPQDWPDPRGFIPESPVQERAERKEKNESPIISHINVYNGNDSEFMQALADYDFLFRDDKRISGKQSILTNRTEFVSFCCRMHIWEIFSTRGGAGPAEKVTRNWKFWNGGERPY